MIQKISQSEFIDCFQRSGRGEQFSYSGLCTLYDWLEESDPDYELDVIGLCCDFTEYENLEAYNKENDPVDDIDDIERETFVIKIDSESFIIQNF
jgi:hypothetical protein